MAAKSVDQRSTEGLAGLLSSLNAAGALSNSASNGSGEQNTSQGIIGPGTNVSPEAMERLTQRLQDLLGDFAGPGQSHLPVNEDGLPIMEFNEHIPAGTIEEDSIERPEPLFFKPFSSMTPGERAERRRQRDAFLDMLEEEERQRELRERTMQGHEGKAMQKLRRDAKKLQEEEVKALLDREPGERIASPAKASAKLGPAWVTKVTDSEDLRLKAEANWKASGKSGAGKGKEKRVSFAGVVEDEEEAGNSPKGPKPRQGSQRLTMKYEIVERMPSKPPSNSLSSIRPLAPKEAVTLVTGPDSDDDSDVGPGGDESEHEPPLGEDEDDEDNEVGIDEALHQREIALRYYQLRQNLDTGPRGDEWDRPEVALDATLAVPNKRLASSISRFMAPRVSDEAMAAVMPRGIESEIKPAKIVDGQLASVDGTESDEGIGETGKKVMGDLARGDPGGGITSQTWDNATSSQGGTASQPTPADQPAVDMGVGRAVPIVVPAKGYTPVVMEVREAGERVRKWQPKAGNGAQRISQFKAKRMAEGE